jgi:tetratricopeptide (TPR) repeat protein
MQRIHGLKAATIIIAVVLISLLPAGCNPAGSLRPVYESKDKTVTEPKIEGEWLSPIGDQATKKQEVARWRISYEKDRYVVEVQYSDADAGERPPSTDTYDASLVSLDNKVFLDAELLERKSDGHTVKTSDMEPGMVPVHLLGRVWLHPDYLRIGMIDSDWLEKHTTDAFRVITHSGGILPDNAVITASTKELHEFLVRNADNAEALSLAFYLCRPDKDCALLVAEDELGSKPNDPDVLRDTARFFNTRGDYDRAVALLRHRVALQPEDAHAMEDLGVGLLFTHDFQGARDEFVAAQKLAPDSPWLEADIGWSYFIEGSFQESARVFGECSQSSKNNSADPILGEYFSLLRLERQAEATAALAGHVAGFSGPTLEQALLLEAQGRTWDGAVAAADDSARARFAFFEGLRWITKGNPVAAAASFKDAAGKAEAGSVLALAAKTEQQRLPLQPKSGGK